MDHIHTCKKHTGSRKDETIFATFLRETIFAALEHVCHETRLTAI